MRYLGLFGKLFTTLPKNLGMILTKEEEGGQINATPSTPGFVLFLYPVDKVNFILHCRREHNKILQDKELCTNKTQMI